MKTKKAKKAELHPLLVKFKDEICANSKTVDPDEDRDWYDLSLGFFLANGLSIKEAEDLACEARYDYHYWC